MALSAGFASCTARERHYAETEEGGDAGSGNPGNPGGAGNEGDVGCHVNNGGCDPNALCEVANGAVTCACNPGYVGDGQTCSDAAEASLCSGVYRHWFNSTFTVPDGPYVGTADFPSFPWGTASGTIAVGQGALTASGASTAVSYQGAHIPRSGMRLRFTFRMQHRFNEVRVALNADDEGADGLEVGIVAGTGEISVLEAGMAIGSATAGPLELDTEYFATLEVGSDASVLWLARENFAPVAGSQEVARIELAAVTDAAGGDYVAIELVDAESLSPTVDNVAISRCDHEPGTYVDIFRDTFERPNSSNLGNAELPATSAWNDDVVQGQASISNGALRFQDGTSSVGVYAEQGEEVEGNRVRLRAVVRPDSAESWPFFIYGSPPPGQPVSSGGTWHYAGVYLWMPNHTRILSPGVDSEIMTAHPFEGATTYYVQLDADGRFMALVVRTGSFTGPVFHVNGTTGALSPPEGNKHVRVAGSNDFRVLDMGLSKFVAQ